MRAVIILIIILMVITYCLTALYFFGTKDLPKVRSNVPAQAQYDPEEINYIHEKLNFLLLESIACEDYNDYYQQEIIKLRDRVTRLEQ